MKLVNFVDTQEPDLIFLDEPTSGLDAASAAHIMVVVREVFMGAVWQMLHGMSRAGKFRLPQSENFPSLVLFSFWSLLSLSLEMCEMKGLRKKQFYGLGFIIWARLRGRN